jgi:hypothetical protein
MKLKIAEVAIILPLVTQCVIAQTQFRRSINFLRALDQPTEQQDRLTREIIQKLATTRVPTSRDAEVLALRFAGTAPGADAREVHEVTGLYVIGRDVPGFAVAEDLFWEVRMSISVSVSRVIWVSTTTQAVKIIFP